MYNAYKQHYTSMNKKILSHGIRVLRLSTWVSVIAALLIVLIIAFFVTFPTLLKAPIEGQLSQAVGLSVELDKITFDFDQDGLVLKVHDFKASSLKQHEIIASVDALRWKINLFSLFDDVYNPSDVHLNTLTIYPDTNTKRDKFGIQDIKQLASKQNLQIFSFLKSLSIQKTLIKRAQTFEIAPMVFTRNKSDILLTVLGQNLNLRSSNATDNKIDIAATLSLLHVSSDQLINIPLSINYHDLSIKSNLKFFTEQGDDVLEVSSHISQIKANKVAQYLPMKLLSNETHAWIKRGFISGNLQDIEIQFKKNLSKDTPAEIQFNAQLKETEFLFNSDWETLRNLDASIQTDGKKIKVMVNSAQLNDMQLNDITVQILNMSLAELNTQIIGKIDTQSEKFIHFLRRAPLSADINEVLDQFTLTGAMKGELNLLIPLDERESILDIDLKLKDNKLTTLKDDVVVEGFNTVLGFHNNKITSKGEGSIRGEPFGIRINPSDRPYKNTTTFSVELAHRGSNFDLYIRKILDQSWRANIVSDNLKGALKIIQEEELLVINILNLEFLSAVEGNWEIKPEDLPKNMYVESENVSIGTYQLPDMQAYFASHDGVLIIKDLKLKGVGVNKELLNFNGGWYPGNKTSLMATAKGKKLSDFLDRFKVKEETKGGEFDFDVRLFCECAPWNINLENMTGIVEMKVKEGVFTNKDPNFGRMLSFLNVRSIARRLRMDVKDLTDKGFVYDDIQANLTIGQSLATVDHFELNSTSSKIQLTGQSDIVKQEYDLEAQVRPAIGDALPIATYLAGGGLAGLGVWLADAALFEGKALDHIMDEIIEFKYKIIGAWSDPIIELL